MKKLNKGFSLVELVVSIGLLSVVVFMLFEIIVVMKNLYTTDGINTELLINQSNLSYAINSKMNEKVLNGVTSCGDKCVTFSYLDGSTDNFKIDQTNTTITFGKNKYTFPKKTKITNVQSSITLVDDTGLDYDAILNIKVEIKNELMKDNDYGINIIYLYKTATHPIYSISL